MKKKIVSLCICAALLAVALVGGTLAFFTDTTEVKENTFTVGNVEIELTEPKWEGEGSVDAPEVYPGEALKKDPTVTNVGANPCFVRVKVTGLNVFEGADPITLRYKDADGHNTTDWTLLDDGYYYYNGVLAAEDETAPVFDQIVIPTSWTNGDAKTAYSVDVFAEAVQAQGAKPSFSAVQGMTAAEIQAWFTTCMPAPTEEN